MSYWGYLLFGVVVIAFVMLLIFAVCGVLQVVFDITASPRLILSIFIYVCMLMPAVAYINWKTDRRRAIIEQRLDSLGVDSLRIGQP